MSMRLAWVNQIDGATLSAGSQIGTLPATNVQHPHLSKKWHTAAGVDTSHVLADLLAEKAIDVLAVLGTNLTSSATMRLRADNADATAQTGAIYDSGNIAAGVVDNYPAFYHLLPVQKTARYWRLDIADAVVPDNLQIGRIFLGPAWACDREYGWGITWQDASVIARSRGGQKWIDEGARARLLQFSLNYQSKADMMDNVFESARRNGLTKELLALLTDGDAYTSRQSVFGLMTLVGEPIIQENARIFRARYQIEESL